MSHPQTLPSPLKIAAEVDAALAAAGLAGPQVEREATPLFLSFLEEMVDAEGKRMLNFNHKSPKNIANFLVCWGQENAIQANQLNAYICEQLDEVMLLCRAHGTLTDMKRRKLMNLHQQIIDYVPHFYCAANIKANKGL
jgi:hypothetical protein